MQLIQLLTYGKLKESYLRAACAEYEKRLSRFCKLQFVELEPVALPERPSEKEIAAALEKEAQPLLKRKKGFTIAMCIEGKQLDSPQFAQIFQRAAVQGDAAVTFFIGSSYGLADSVKQAANLRLSMSQHVGNDLSPSAGKGNAVRADLSGLSDFRRQPLP